MTLRKVNMMPIKSLRRKQMVIAHITRTCMCVYESYCSLSPSLPPPLSPDEEEEEEEEEDDPYIDELNEQLAEIDNEEAPEEEEEEEETEEDVEDRMRTALVEKYEEQTESLTGIQV